MAIALDAVSSGRNSTGTITVSHTVGAGSDRVLYVMTSAQDSNHANLPVTGITFGGVALTKVRHDEAAGNNRTEIWRLIAPATSTANIVCTVTGSVGEFALIGISLTGVDQTTPTDANNGASGNSSAPSVSVTSVTDNAWLLAMASAETTFSSNGTGQTTIATLTDQSYENARGTYEGPKTPAGADTQSFVIASGQSWAISSVAVRPVAGADTTDPTVSTLSPADNATGVAINANLVIEFDEPVNVGTGNITIKKTSDNSTVQTIDVTSGLVTGTGTTTITINPSDLANSTEYYVLIDATCFDDAAGNSYAGISSTTAWSFTTVAETTNPTVSTLSPLDNAVDVAVNTNLVIVFDEAVNVETGNITIKKTSDNSTIETIDVTSGQVTGDGTNTITINPSDLDISTEYYVLIDATAFDDLVGNSYAGISSTTAWSFTTSSITEVYVPPTAQPVTETRVFFIIESIDGTFRYATESWDFGKITREINGTMSADIRTDQLNTEVQNSITSLMNRITIRIVNEHTGPTGIDYFSGYIPQQDFNIRPGEGVIEFIALGHASRLQNIPYRDGTTTTIDKTAGIKASDLAKDVIDKVRALDSTFVPNYSATSVEDSTDTIRDKFVSQKAMDVMNRAALLAYDAGRIWYWVILGDNIFRMKKSATSAQHNFTFGKDVLFFPRFVKDVLQARNEIMVHFNGGANIKRVVDTASIAEYGLMSEDISEPTIPNTDSGATATEFGNSVLESRRPPILSITVTIGSNYHLGMESIDPGQTCDIQNLVEDIQQNLTDNMFITRTVYDRAASTVELELSLKTPFLQNQVESIRRRFAKQSFESDAATSYS